jgi:DNA-binding LacI/PurR family transcriptional regulator
LNDIEASKYKEKLNNMRMPLIAVGNILDNCNSICPNHYGEIVLAVDHLVKNGHSKISIVLDNADIRAGKERLRGYLETMKKHGLSPMASYDYHPKKQSLIELMAIMMQDSPTATIICGESISNEAVYALNLLGVKVPEKLSLISFEKQDSSRWFSPPHTTIDQNVLKIVTESMLLIEKIIAVRPKEKICTQLPCSLVVRNSVKNINI